MSEVTLDLIQSMQEQKSALKYCLNNFHLVISSVSLCLEKKTQNEEYYHRIIISIINF